MTSFINYQVLFFFLLFLCTLSHFRLRFDTRADLDLNRKVKAFGRQKSTTLWWNWLARYMELACNVSDPHPRKSWIVWPDWVFQTWNGLLKCGELWHEPLKKDTLMTHVSYWIVAIIKYLDEGQKFIVCLCGCLLWLLQAAWLFVAFKYYYQY